MRRVVIIAIFVIWTGALVALFVNDPGPVVRQEAPPTTESFDHGGSEEGEWWGVYLQGHKVGFTHHQLIETGRQVSFRQESVLVLTTLGVKQTVRTEAFGELNESFAVQSMKFALVAGPTRLEVQATAHEGGLRVTTSPGRETIELEGPVSLPLGLRAAVTEPPLEVGRTIRGRVFDPMTQATGMLQLRIEQRGLLPGQQDRQAWRITETWRDVQSTLWVDEDGHLVREEGPMGLVAVREPESKAAQISAVDAEWDAVEAVSLPVEPPIDDPRHRENLRVRLSGIARERIPSNGGQSVDAEGVSVTRVEVVQADSYSLPYAGAEHAAELEPTSSLQADHPRITALAKTIVGTERDALAATRSLVNWVFRYLNKIPTASLPDALQVLDTGQGDCNEHAVLLAALARAAGIPARIASGLVYGDGAFLYHAWTEVWIGGWVPVDATMDQVPADATHITLTVGDRDQQLLMMGMLGNLSIEVIAGGASNDVGLE